MAMSRETMDWVAHASARITPSRTRLVGGLAIVGGVPLPGDVSVAGSVSVAGGVSVAGRVPVTGSVPVAGNDVVGADMSLVSTIATGLHTGLDAAEAPVAVRSNNRSTPDRQDHDGRGEQHVQDAAELRVGAYHRFVGPVVVAVPDCVRCEAGRHEIRAHIVAGP
jgi:hypothetical protein